MRLETRSEGCRKENEQRHETFPDRAARRLRIRDNVGQETLHALHPKTGKNLRKTLRRSLPVHTGSIGLESTQQSRDQIGEVDFSKSLDESAEGLCGSGSCFWYWVDKNDVHHREEAR